MRRYETGQIGEKNVCIFLQNQGYEILQRNFRVKNGEVDIIATDGEIIAFVEVKTRCINSMDGLDAISIGQRRRIIRTAEIYMEKHNLQLQPRFDAALIILERGLLCNLEYIENAFDGTSVYDEIKGDNYVL